MQANCVGQPLTSLFRLVEEDDGRMPLLAALASRSAVEAQRAVIRGGGPDEVIIDATPLSDAAGQFAGFHGALRGNGDRDAVTSEPPAFEESLDEALRSPLDRIISAADRIVERSDGPLRSDYATYASDIAAAGRHLLSVIRSMGGGRGGRRDRRPILLSCSGSDRLGAADSRGTRHRDHRRTARGTVPRQWRRARDRPDLGQHYRQCRSPFTRQWPGDDHVRRRRQRAPR